MINSTLKLLKSDKSGLRWCKSAAQCVPHILYCISIQRVREPLHLIDYSSQDNQLFVQCDEGEHQEEVTDSNDKQFDLRINVLISVYFSIHSCIRKICRLERTFKMMSRPYHDSISFVPMSFMSVFRLIACVFLQSDCNTGSISQPKLVRHKF